MVTIPESEYDTLVSQVIASRELISFLKDNMGNTADFPITIEADADIANQLTQYFNNACEILEL